MEKISQDYEELKKAFDSQKCPKDDKILALRKTARALETENELLHEEKMMIGKENERIRRGLETRLSELEKQEQNHQVQVQKYVQEQQDLKSKLDKSEQEKLTLSVRFTSLEKELENCKTQLNKVQLGEVMNILHFVYFSFYFPFFINLNPPFINLICRKRGSNRGESTAW